MRGPRSLRRRIVGAFTVFAVLLIGALVLSFHVVFHSTEDTVLRRQLEVETEHLLSHPELLDRPSFEVGRYMTAYVGLGGAPPELRARLQGLGPGAHEFGDFDEPFADEEVHIVVRALDGRSELLYLVLDATSLEAARRVGPIYLTAVLVGLLMVGVVGAATGRILAGLVIEPVTSLADRLRGGSLDSLADEIEPASYGEEVGVLAEALRDAARRLRGFVERERRFTANASHELRTPITVIRGAAELLEAYLGDREPAVQNPLARIRRAVDAMEETIEVFLALAREGELAAPVQGCSLADIVADVVEQHRQDLGDRPVGVVVRVPGTVRVEAPPRALAIVLGNLVGNALRRTLRGSVTISWNEDRLDVVDTGPGIPEELAGVATERHVSADHGHGIGLSVVTAICERFGWELHLHGAEGSGTRATLVL